MRVVTPAGEGQNTEVSCRGVSLTINVRYRLLASRLGINLDAISLEDAVAYYERMREMEWERHL
jgi:hypothetical protein